MTKVRVMLKCTLGPLARRKVERDFDDEVRFHLQMETENNLRKGMTEEEARNRALAQFGRVAAVKETCRETRSLPWLEVRVAGTGLWYADAAAESGLRGTHGPVPDAWDRSEHVGFELAGSNLRAAGSAGVAPRTLDGHNRN